MCKDQNKTELNEIEKQIIKHLEKETEIVTVVEGEFSFESKDLTNQFQFIELARLEEKGVVYSNLTSHEENVKVRKYHLTKLGMELLVKINKEETENKGVNNMGRKSWDQYFLEIAEVVATRATCNRLQVGCVIVKDKNIVSTGYNGSIHGHPHCTDEGVGCLLNDEGRCIRTIHAEANALFHADRDLLKGATAYVTHLCCENCSKALAQAGIVKIVYRHHYDNKYNKHFLTNIQLLQLSEDNELIRVEL